MTTAKLYDFAYSGSCYRARLMLALSAVPHEIIPVDLDANEQRSEKFLKINPLGQVPVLVDGNTVLRDSHAILSYLASTYSAERAGHGNPSAAAAIVQWLCYSAYEIANGPAMGRMIKLGIKTGDLDAAQARTKAVLEYVNTELQDKDWLVPPKWTIADIACYPYIESAGDGGVDLKNFPAILAWIERIKGLPGYVKKN